jgi:hypothetical protein
LANGRPRAEDGVDYRRKLVWRAQEGSACLAGEWLIERCRPSHSVNLPPKPSRLSTSLARSSVDIGGFSCSDDLAGCRVGAKLASRAGELLAERTREASARNLDEKVAGTGTQSGAGGCQGMAKLSESCRVLVPDMHAVVACGREHTSDRRAPTDGTPGKEA